MEDKSAEIKNSQPEDKLVKQKLHKFSLAIWIIPIVVLLFVLFGITNFFSSGKKVAFSAEKKIAFSCETIQVDYSQFGNNQRSQSDIETEQQQATEQLNTTSGELTQLVQEHTNSVTTSEPLKDQIKNRLKVRKQLLMKAIQHNPDEAIKVIHAFRDKKEVLTEPDNCVESPAEFEGQLDVVHADYENGTSEWQYRLILPDKSIVVFNPTRPVELALERNVRRLKLRGYKLENTFVADEVKDRQVWGEQR